MVFFPKSFSRLRRRVPILSALAAWALLSVVAAPLAAAAPPRVPAAEEFNQKPRKMDIRVCPDNMVPTGCGSGTICRPKRAFDERRDAGANCQHTKTKGLCQFFQLELCCIISCNDILGGNNKGDVRACIDRCQVAE